MGAGGGSTGLGNIPKKTISFDCFPHSVYVSDFCQSCQTKTSFILHKICQARVLHVFFKPVKSICQSYYSEFLPSAKPNLLKCDYD